MGDYPELFSVASSSILGARGHSHRHLGFYSTIEVVEVDDSGRVLFRYSEPSSFPTNTDCFVIIQRNDEEYVYFYPHYNFIANMFTGSTDREDKINALKEANSWNREMSDDSEFERVRIVRQKEIGLISDSLLIDVYHEIFSGVEINPRRNAVNQMHFLRMDDYGRSVYLGTGVGREWMYTNIAVIFQPDHSFDLETGKLVITDNDNYQTELRLFKEANGWNTPP